MNSDAQRLLFRIQSLLGVAAVTVGSQGCNARSVPGTGKNAVAKQAEPKGRKARIEEKQGPRQTQRPILHGQGGTALSKADDKKKAASAQGAGPASTSRTVVNKLPPAPIPGYRFGDPPFVEGWNPEESTCVSGNWCGPVAAAAKVVRIGMEDELDPESKCPTHLMGKKEGGVDPKKKVYRGLSADRMMRGTFQPWRTQRTREQRGKQDICCYHWFDYCAGRPLDEGARTQQGRIVAAASQGDEVCDAQAMRLARSYWADADDEYDSVAAFARCSLELFALGAPPELIEASQRASLDELRHARACQALSKHYYDHDWPVRAPTAVKLGEVELEEFLWSTFRHGCVGEAVASLRVTRMAAKSSDSRVRGVLEGIAKEEAEHAALAWKIVAWGLSVGDGSLKEKLASQAALLEAELLAKLDPAASAGATDGERLTPQELRDCAGDAWCGVVRPMLAALGVKRS